MGNQPGTPAAQSLQSSTATSSNPFLAAPQQDSQAWESSSATGSQSSASAPHLHKEASSSSSSEEGGSHFFGSPEKTPRSAAAAAVKKGASFVLENSTNAGRFSSSEEEDGDGEPSSTTTTTTTTTTTETTVVQKDGEVVEVSAGQHQDVVVEQKGGVARAEHQAASVVVNDSGTTVKEDHFVMGEGAHKAQLVGKEPSSRDLDDFGAQHVVEGFLKKQTISHTAQNHSRWRERFFQLKRGGLFYFEVANTLEYGLGGIKNLENCDDAIPVVLSERKKIRGYRFKLFFNTPMPTPPIMLAALTKNKVQEWIRVITQCIELARSGKYEWPRIPGGEEEDARFSAIYTRCGELYYNTGTDEKARHWTVRRVLIGDGKLIIQKRVDKGFVALDGATTQVHPEGRFVLTVHTAENKFLNLYCGSKQNMRRWKRAIDNFCTDASKHLPKDDDPATGNTVMFINKIRDVLENEAKLVSRHHKHHRQLTSSAPDVRSQSPERSAVGSLAEKKRVLILSFDGGGSRGIIPLIILERILEVFPDLLSKVDIVTGTSNGAMTALSLAFGHHPLSIREMMEITGREIFSERKAFATIHQAKWSNRFLRIFCKEVWADKKLSDAQIRVLVPAFNLDNKHSDPTLRQNQVEVFHNFTVRSETASELAADVVLRTTAAPTYFSSWQGYVDGGLFAHDPSALCLSHVLSSEVLGVPIDKVHVLSFSTGHCKAYYEADPAAPLSHDWGYYQWAPKLPTVLWDGMIQTSQMTCRVMLGDRLHRVDPQLDSELPMDNPDVFAQLASYGSNFNLFETLQWIKTHFYNEEDA